MVNLPVVKIIDKRLFVHHILSDLNNITEKEAKYTCYFPNNSSSLHVCIFKYAHLFCITRHCCYYPEVPGPGMC